MVLTLLLFWLINQAHQLQGSRYDQPVQLLQLIPRVGLDVGAVVRLQQEHLQLNEQLTIFPIRKESVVTYVLVQDEVHPDEVEEVVAVGVVPEDFDGAVAEVAD